ncbi:MAG TPA: GNAT family N-acetyltransferase [Candidatus Limnocylindrales bacterium]|nr:GNAT family N-acetyltransferase [Candidatus Limnocylindrales bacterium]
MQTLGSSAVAIRAITPEDRAGLGRFYAGLSAESLELRFHGGMPRVGDATTHYFCLPDHRRREGLVAEVVNGEGRRTIVGHLCIEPVGSSQPDTAEIAVVVADEWQRRGVGRALLAAAIDWAGQHGFSRLTASLLWGNAPMLNLIRSTGRPVAFGASGAGTLEAVLDVQAAVAAPRAA